jgi:hypothetical protein
MKLSDFNSELGQPRPIQLAGVSTQPVSGSLWLGRDSHSQPLQICVFESASALPDGKMERVWEQRRGNAATNVLIVVLHDGTVDMAGPVTRQGVLPLLRNMDAVDALRVLKLAKESPDSFSAIKFLHLVFGSIHSELSGLNNSGLFADHILKEVVQEEGSPYNSEFKEASKKAKPLLSKTTKELIQGLGFKVTSNDSRTDILLDADDRQVALAVLLHENESPDSASPAFNNQTPISHALTQASKRNLKWVITLAPDRTIRLYPAVLNVGVGRRGATETFIELHAGLLKDENAGLLWMIFSADALLDKGSVSRLLEDSTRFSGSLAQDLRERIYVEVMPRLAKGIADVRRSTNKDDEFLKDTLQMATHVLFRLLFIAYAEDKDLLPYAHSSAYRKSSLKAIAQEILESIRKGAQFGDTTRLWEQVSVLCDSISKGNKTLDIPAYNGVLFSSDKDDSPHGEAISKVKLKDSVFGHVLAGLLLTKGKDGNLGPVDFRSLGVREFGTIYEGLLESELSEAKEDLSIKSKDGDQIYVPAAKKEHAAVKEGEFYLHNKSGARKASGAYFTKEFAVDHLLDLALDKALDDHLLRVAEVAKKSEHDAAELLFDFRVADIAMGSGHFLIYAIDRIERKFREYLITNPLPPVRIQLNELREAARSELGESADILEGRLEDAALLRRLIARRCIYGVDMNPISVQLAQLAVWIHTFVPGLPLSFLEHNLIQGNSLIGVANQRDFEDLLDDARLAVRKYLDEALPLIRKMGAIADKNVADVKEMKKLRVEALSTLEPAIAAMDIAVWKRAKGNVVSDAGDDLMGLLQDSAKLLRSNMLREARKGLQPLGCRHLMACFPEVFLRMNSGFDVLLGNPPWEKVHFEEPQFWSKHINGYYAMNPAERLKAESAIKASINDIKTQLNEMHSVSEERSHIYGNLYSDPKGSVVRYGTASGHPDLFRMFAWRFWELLRAKGRVGLVLPRTALSGDVMSAWRNRLIKPLDGISQASLSVTVLANKAGWVFDDIDTRYTVCLCAIYKAPGVNSLMLNGPFEEKSRFDGERLVYAEFSAEEVGAWTDSCKLPLLPSVKTQELFRKIRKQPNLVEDNDISSKWRCRPIQELNSTSNKDLFDLKGEAKPAECMPVYKGESFDLWEPDRGEDRYYGRVKSNKSTIDELYRKRSASFQRGNSSPWAGADAKEIKDIDTIECRFHRIAFRDITNRTNTRTLVAALLPPEVVCTHKAPVLVWSKGADTDRAYLIGILSSRICDWYTRRWVEMTMSFTIFNTIPCPKMDSSHLLYGEMVQAAGRLSCPDKRFAKWAKAVGVECGPLNSEDKQALVDRVDATSALLYGLSEQELETVFETFHEGWDWKPDYARVLAEYRRLKTKFKI